MPFSTLVWHQGGILETFVLARNSPCCSWAEGLFLCVQSCGLCIRSAAKGGAVSLFSAEAVTKGLVPWDLTKEDAGPDPF